MYGITNPPQFEMSQNVARLPVPQIEITQNTARRRWMFFLIQTAYKRCLPESKFLDLILEVAFKKIIIPPQTQPRSTQRIKTA